MRVLFLTSCTGKKKHSPPNLLRQEDFLHLGQPAFYRREKSLSAFMLPAKEMYTGRQHKLVQKGIRDLQKACPDIRTDLMILSAGYGLISGEKQIAPYEMTFTGMKEKDLPAWAGFLNIPKSVMDALNRYDLSFVLLGKQYLKACRFPKNAHFSGEVVFVTGKSGISVIPDGDGIHNLVLSNPDGKRLGAPLVAIKGRVVEVLGEKAGQEDRCIFTDDRAYHPEKLEDILDYLRFVTFPKKENQPKGSSRGRKPKNIVLDDRYSTPVHIPKAWYMSPHKKKLRYFIPDWDDLVNPAYDFMQDSHPEGTGDGYMHGVYAHQIYDCPQYDGILVSRVIVEKRKHKQTILEKTGIHKYLRVPEDFPVMGDCGAFGYIAEEYPPFETQEIIHYYNRLGFDYGVSIDHLIVSSAVKKIRYYRLDPGGEPVDISKGTYQDLLQNGGVEVESLPKHRQTLIENPVILFKKEEEDTEEMQRRYDLTLQNAQDFISLTQNGPCSFIPVAAVQGWSPQTYRDAVSACQDMGYSMIAIGGLVRTHTRGILEILEEVNQVRKKGVDIHLFGVARPEAILQMHRLGVTSIDSATFLRKAWLGAGTNYYCENGNFYAAIRVPDVGASPRARKILREGRADIREVERLDRVCMDMLHMYDKEEVSLQDVLSAVLEYEALLGEKRKGYNKMIEQTLLEKPWKKCPCPVCRQLGIDVMIFRGNNRNRRRGFHNTWVFYQKLKKIFSGDTNQ